MAKSVLRQLGSSTWVLEGPTNIGFIQQGDKIWLVDSGNDKEAGRRINKTIKDMGWVLGGLINTHSNADHIGGNDYLQRNLQCPIYAPAGEVPFIHYPELEAAFLWGGMPVRELENKFFRAKSSRVTHPVTLGQVIENDIQTYALPGHFFDMMGVASADGVFFLADSLFGRTVLDKYKLPFIYDLLEYKKSLAAIQTIPATYYVPSHGPVEEDIAALAAVNLQVVEMLEEYLQQLLQKPSHFDFILKAVCDHYGLTLNFGQYALVGSTLRSFLSALHNEGKLSCSFQDNTLLWQTMAQESREQVP